VTLTDQESIDTRAGSIRVVPAREWFFHPQSWLTPEAGP